MTLPEVEALPVVAPAQPVICAVYGISPATYYRLLAEDDLPVRTVRVGRSRKVLRTDLLRALGEQSETRTAEDVAEPRPLRPVS